MSRIFYITKSFTGLAGGLLRKKQIELLETNGFRVSIVTIADFNSKTGIKLFFHKLAIKISFVAQYIGIVEDYLDPWIFLAFKKLSKNISKDDIMFSTGSGELGCYKLGHILSKKIGCRHIANLHDPVTYTYINGMRFLKPLFHVKRDGSEFKYLSGCESIITSSKTYSENLKTKYPSLSSKIHNSYFGYIEKCELLSYPSISKIKIVYAGTFDTVQSPEILVLLAERFPNIEVHFIGNYNNYKPLHGVLLGNVIFHDYLLHDKFLEVMQSMNVGFVSLKGGFYENCFPSKIFEYINLGLPIFGILPKGDAMDFVNHGGYGFITEHFEIESLIETFNNFNDFKKLEFFKRNIIKDRDNYQMSEQFKNILNLLT
jgi:hypothetical protein